MEKKALGKGLAALLPESEAKETGQTIHMIPVTQILPNRYQPRKRLSKKSSGNWWNPSSGTGFFSPSLCGERVKIAMNSLQGSGGSARLHWRNCRLSQR